LDEYSNNSNKPSTDDHAIDSINDGSKRSSLKYKDSDLNSGRVLEESNLPQASSSKSLLNEGILAGQRIAKISVVTLVSIGIVEILTGYYSGSVVATADGIDSMSDAVISFIVLLGLRIAHRPADRKFHFGYHKVESFAALMAAIGMVAIGIVIFYNSYQAILHPHEIRQPVLTMVVLAAAGGISLHRAFQMRNIANKYNLLSLKTDAKNSIKDGSASVIGFFSVLIASQFGFLQMDAIGGMIIACYIFSVSYISLKKSSLILVDSWQNPKLTELIKQHTEKKQFRVGEGLEQSQTKVMVRSVLLRPTGMVSQAEVHIEVDGNRPLKDVEMICLQVEMEIRSHFSDLERISTIPHSSISESLTAVSPSSRLLKRWVPARERLRQYRQKQKQQQQPLELQLQQQRQHNTMNLRTEKVELVAGSTNNLEIQGRVINNLTTTVDDVRINVQFYDSKGKLLREISRSIIQPSYLLQPGEIISFVVPEALDFAQIANYDIVAQAEIDTNMHG
jgi:cation diffusion facilitator family transporter